MKKAIVLLVIVCCSYGLSAQSTLTKKETKFIKHVAEISLLEIKIGELAATNASSQVVKSTAPILVSDYKKTEEDIKALAAKKSVILPTELCPKKQKFYTYFTGKKGNDFDKAYTKCTAKANKKGLCKVKKINKRTNDAELKAWSSEMLVTLEKHKALLKETCDNLKNKK